MCSENNGNFLFSRVWRVLSSKIFLLCFILYYYMPLKYDKIFSCIHCLLCLRQPLRLFLWAQRFSFVKRNGSKNLYKILRNNKIKESAMSKTRVYEWYKRFQDGREDVDERPGRPSTSAHQHISNWWKRGKSERNGYERSPNHNQRSR